MVWRIYEQRGIDRRIIERDEILYFRAGRRI